MKLIVFGASGQCGQHLVRLAAERHHDVTAVVRPSTPYVAPAGVTVLRGDVLDAAFVGRGIRGHEAVASGLGIRYRHPWAARQSPDDFISRATQAIVQAMRAADVRRISVISAAGVGDSRAHANWPIRLLIATSNVGTAYADLERVERILEASGLDWQAVRPTTLSNRQPGPVRLTDAFGWTASVPRASVAAFMLDELEQPRFTCHTPMITGMPRRTS